jgi:hypothetical protein
VVDAIGADRTLVVCLRARAEVVAARVGSRESDQWPGKETLVKHSQDLAVAIPELHGIDVFIDSAGRPATTVVGEVHERMTSWVPSVTAHAAGTCCLKNPGVAGLPLSGHPRWRRCAAAIGVQR